MTAREHRLHRAETEALTTLLTWTNGQKVGAPRLYVYLLRLSAEAGSRTFSASHRHLADAAGFGYSDKAAGGHLNTSGVRDALRALEALGVIRLESVPLADDGSNLLQARTRVTLLWQGPPSEVGPSRVHDGSLYRLLPCVDALEGWNAHSASGSLFDVFQHVVWEERQGLGVNALRVWMALHAVGAQTPTHLAKRLHLGRRTVHKWLAQLEHCGLAGSDAGTWHAVPRSLDEVADELGLSERKERRSKVKVHQRAGYVHWLIRRGAIDCPLLARLSPFDERQVLQYPRNRPRVMQGPIGRDRHLRLVA